VIRRFYVHNFRCLENFELPIAGKPSVLLIGANGSGKTAVSAALMVLQRIARGTNRVGDLVKAKDLSRGRTDVPMRFEIEVELKGKVYSYSIAFELPENSKELRVFEEKLAVGGEPVYSREGAQLHAPLADREAEASMEVNRGIVLLAITETTPHSAIYVFKQWLASMLILRPIPSLIQGESGRETLHPESRVGNLGAWFAGLLASRPSAYATIEGYLKEVMPDLRDIKNPFVGPESRSLVVEFSNEKGTVTIPFADLSDGEKCFIVCALVLAACNEYGPLFCFWDEPDNYLAISEVGHFVLALRKAFKGSGQFVATSHNDEAIRRFSKENTLVLQRRSHLEPTVVRWLDELHISGDLIGSLIRGEVEGFGMERGNG
jgi:predicted ATPase